MLATVFSGCPDIILRFMMRWLCEAGVKRPRSGIDLALFQVARTLIVLDKQCPFSKPPRLHDGLR